MTPGQFSRISGSHCGRHCQLVWHETAEAGGTYSCFDVFQTDRVVDGKAEHHNMGVGI